MYVTSDDGYQNLLVSATVLSFLILDSNTKVNYLISTGILSETSKPFDTNLDSTMSNLPKVGNLKI